MPGRFGAQGPETGAAGAATGVEPETDLMAGQGLADPLELEEGAGVDVDALLKKGGELLG